MPYEQELFANTPKNANEVAETLLAEGPGLARVLDIPCGEGTFTRRLPARGLEVHSADIRPVAKVNLEHFVRADMDGPPPWPDGCLDAAASVDGFEHLARPFDFLAECARLLRPGGTMILCTPNTSSLRSFHDLRYRLHTRGLQLTAIQANQSKAASWLHLPWVPLAGMVTAWSFAREKKDAAVKHQNREILRQMFSVPVLFGELLAVKAVKKQPLPAAARR